MSSGDGNKSVVTAIAADERIEHMSGFGEQRHHGTYDDVAAELGAAARRLAAPLAVVARKRAVESQREATGNRAMAKATETALNTRQANAVTGARRGPHAER